MNVRLLIFAKAPIPGLCKTRLVPVLGVEGAARLQGVLIEQTVRCCVETGIGGVELWCAPDVTHPLFVDCARRFGLQLYPQGVGDLGERMFLALSHALRRCPAAVLIGTDAPEMGAMDLRSAIEVLHSGSDAVLAPAFDGGYVMIGLRRIDPVLFRDVAWGSGGVMQQTRERLELLGYQWQELRCHHDIDRPEDWKRLLQRQPSWAERTALTGV